MPSPSTLAKKVEREIDGTPVTITGGGLESVHKWMESGMSEGTGWSYDKKAWPKALKRFT